MSSPIGIAIQLAVAGKINSGDNYWNDVASERHRGRPGEGFPGNRRVY